MTSAGNNLNGDPRESSQATAGGPFADATDIVDELLADPELAEESAAIRERMREADPGYSSRRAKRNSWVSSGCSGTAGEKARASSISTVKPASPTTCDS